MDRLVRRLRAGLALTVLLGPLVLALGGCAKRPQEQQGPPAPPVPGPPGEKQPMPGGGPPMRR